MISAVDVIESRDRYTIDNIQHILQRQDLTSDIKSCQILPILQKQINIYTGS